MLGSAAESVWRWGVIESASGGGAGEWNCSSPTKRPCALAATLCCILPLIGKSQPTPQSGGGEGTKGWILQRFRPVWRRWRKRVT
ncbi:hypothetical protein Ddc_16001 [Ditylenchus destructor]|nr:hypothetical protein Ddc_16001 [Ditylenchus destructor]